MNRSSRRICGKCSATRCSAAVISASVRFESWWRLRRRPGARFWNCTAPIAGCAMTAPHYSSVLMAMIAPPRRPVRRVLPRKKSPISFKHVGTTSRCSKRTPNACGAMPGSNMATFMRVWFATSKSRSAFVSRSSLLRRAETPFVATTKMTIRCYFRKCCRRAAEISNSPTRSACSSFARRSTATLRACALPIRIRPRLLVLRLPTTSPARS